MMPLEPESTTSTPRTAFGPFDQAELFAECGRIPGRPRANSAWPKHIPTDFQVAAKPSKFGVMEVSTSLFHDESPVLKPGNPLEASHAGQRFPLHWRSPETGHPTDSWCLLFQ